MFVKEILLQNSEKDAGIEALKKHIAGEYTAERYTQKFGVPRFVLKLYSRSVYWRWKLKLFWLDLEIPVIRLLFRWFVNPIDYKLAQNYGDSFTAKESDIIHVEAKPAASVVVS